MVLSSRKNVKKILYKYHKMMVLFYHTKDKENAASDVFTIFYHSFNCKKKKKSICNNIMYRV